MEERKFLGFMVTPYDIKANPEKQIQAVVNMESPKTKKQVQSLNGKLAALNLFLSIIADRSLPFFKVFKGSLRKKQFSRMEEADEAFQQMKAFLLELPTLTTQISNEVSVSILIDNQFSPVSKQRKHLDARPRA